MKLLAAMFFMALTGLPGTGIGGEIWTALEPGLDMARFDNRTGEVDSEGEMVVVRVDPDLFDLRLLTPDDVAPRPGLSARDWCGEFSLLLAVNAGMYQADRKTHVGYCKVSGRIINSFANDYLSAAAFGPYDAEDPYFHIFDLDETPLGEVAARYRNVVQNLRLIKRAGENRWQKSGDSWREAALGEDWKGRILFIYCDRPQTMYEFNRALLALPIGLVTAQHLEGRGQARLWLSHPDVNADALPGSLVYGTRLPNIIGVAHRD